MGVAEDRSARYQQAQDDRTTALMVVLDLNDKGCSIVEISRQTGMSESTVRALLDVDKP